MREGIYVGNKEVTKRYIGDILVWEKLKLLFSGKETIFYNSFTREVSILNQELSLENVKAIEINGQKIAVSSVRKGTNITVFKVDSAKEFERKTNLKRSTPYYQGLVKVKVYGGE